MRAQPAPKENPNLPVNINYVYRLGRAASRLDAAVGVLGHDACGVAAGDLLADAPCVEETVRIGKADGNVAVTVPRNEPNSVSDGSHRNDRDRV